MSGIMKIEYICKVELQLIAYVIVRAGSAKSVKLSLNFTLISNIFIKRYFFKKMIIVIPGMIWVQNWLHQSSIAHN